MSDSAQDHYKMKNQLLLETEVVKYLLVGNASGETFQKPLPLGGLLPSN